MIKILTPIFETLTHVNKFSSTTTQGVNLVGRSYLKSTDFDTKEIKSILWTAFNLKHMLMHKCCEVNIIKSARITMLLHGPSMKVQASAISAANLLKAHLNVIIDPSWETGEFISDVGSFLSTCSDIILCKTKYQSKIEKLAEGSVIPVVCVKSCMYSIIDVLADLMTLQEKFGHLKNLNIGWVGSPSPLINTYLCIAPRLGINMQYCCACASGAGMSPAALPVARNISEKQHTLMHECQDATAAISKAHVIVVSRHNIPEFSISLEHISKKADKHWVFLHALGRRSTEVHPEVFDHKNSLVWEAKGNLQWIYAAIMVRLLSQYTHVSEMPHFDKDVKCCK